MKNLMIALFLIGFASHANASSYTFSYNFVWGYDNELTRMEGARVTGSFDGTDDGNIISNITNFFYSFENDSDSFDVNPISPDFPYYFPLSSKYVSTQAQLSFDGWSNDLKATAFGDAGVIRLQLLSDITSTQEPVPELGIPAYSHISIENYLLLDGVQTYYGFEAIPQITTNSPYPFDWSVSRVSAVPVPAAVWLFGTALIGFVGMSRRIKVG